MNPRGAAVAVAVVAAAFVAVAAVDSEDAPPAARAAAQLAGGERPTEALATLDPPPDLDAAVTVARDFTTALVDDDHARVAALADGALADRLSDPATAGPAGRSAARVESTVVRDARSDRVLVDVIVHHRPGAIAVVTVAIARTPQGWRAIDTAF